MRLTMTTPAFSTWLPLHHRRAHTGGEELDALQLVSASTTDRVPRSSTPPTRTDMPRSSKPNPSPAKRSNELRSLLRGPRFSPPVVPRAPCLLHLLGDANALRPASHVNERLRQKQLQLRSAPFPNLYSERYNRNVLTSAPLWTLRRPSNRLA